MKSIINKIKPIIITSFCFYGFYSLTSALFPLLTKSLLDRYSEGKMYVLRLFFLFVVLVGSNTLFEYLNRVWEWKISKAFIIDTKQALFSRFISQDTHDFQKQSVQDYVTMMNNNVEVMDEDYISGWIDLIKSLLQLLIFSLSMFWVLGWAITLVILLFSIVISYLPHLTQKHLAKLRKDHLAEVKRYNNRLFDFLFGHKYITTRTIDAFRSLHKEALVAAETKHFHFGHFRVLSDMINSFGTNLMTLLVFLLAGFLLVDQKITLGTASAAFLYTGELIGAMANVLSCINVLNSSKDVVAEIKEQLTFAEKKGVKRSFLSIENLQIPKFFYRREGYVLTGKDIFFEKGKAYAIIGQSGSGKSTFFQLLNGEIKIAEMQVLANSRTFFEPARLENIFTLQQKEHLFEADFYDNVTIFQTFPLRKEIPELLEKLPKKMQQRLVNYKKIDSLSGGEQQLISLLRAFNLHYPILLMDEAYAHIDQETKKGVSAYLRAHNDGILIEITHDLAKENLACYDEILRVYQGEISKLETKS